MGLLKNLFSKSSKRGQILKKIGIGIGSVGIGLEFDPLSLEQMLTDEKYIFWLLVIKYVCYSLGGILTVAGAATTPEDDEQKPKVK